MKWLRYLLFIVGIYLLVVLQTSYFAAWGTWGAVLHPVLWAVVYISFFSRKNLWLLVVLGGFLLDVIGLSFGLNILALSIVALSLKLLHGYYLAVSNLLSWLLTSLVAVLSYALGAFIINNSLGIVWQWQFTAKTILEENFMFGLLNILGLALVFGIHKLWYLIINGK